MKDDKETVASDKDTGRAERAEIYNKINKVMIQTAGVSEKVGAILSDVTDIKETLKHVNETLNGNGKPGLKERVGVLEWRVLGISSQAENESNKSFEKHMSLRGAAIALIVAGLSFLAGAVFEYVKGLF